MGAHTKYGEYVKFFIATIFDKKVEAKMAFPSDGKISMECMVFEINRYGFAKYK